MRRRLRVYVQDDFFRHNAIFFVGSLLVAVLNYLYHPIISRLLTVEQFGEVQGFLSIAVQLGVVAMVFGMVVMNIKTTTEDGRHAHTISSIYSLGMLVSVVIALVILLLSSWLGAVFSLSEERGWWLVALAIILGMPRVFAKFHLQAEKKFGLVSGTELIVSGGKIVIALVLFWFGYDVLGALGGFVLAVLFGLLFMYPFTQSALALRALHWPRLTPELTNELRYGGLVLMAVGFTTFLYTADILLMRYFFNDELSGQYAGIATVARIIVFATASVGSVLLAHVTRSKTEAENKQILKKGFIMTLAIGAGAVVVFSSFPHLVVGTLMGPQFLPLAWLLPLLSFAMLLVSVVNLMVMYFLALRRYSLIIAVILSISVIAGGVFLWHTTVTEILYVIVAGLIIASSFLSYLIWTR